MPPEENPLDPTLKWVGGSDGTPDLDSDSDGIPTAGSEPRKDDTDPHDITLPGYTIGKTIGIGGMGEVVAARDADLGREVAIKRLKGSPSDAAIARFLREAKIQARLDHPAIAPVHEVGTDANGKPFFTMKRLRGTTLSGVFKGKRATTQQELLRTFVDVCQAVRFAHERGIVHRDLKPGNIMLGDFGEVYVIDWGVARVLEEREVATADIDLATGAGAGMTQAGALLGTPGYMAPEQMQSSAVGPAADVYSLGAILFEILARVPLHPKGIEALKSTMIGGDTSPALRRHVALDPEQRPTARVLGDTVQRYLDGDRDVERRRTLAAAELAAARTALGSGDDHRAEAIRAAGRALALDPESRDAAALISSLMLEPPKQLPPALVADLAATESRLQSRQLRVGMKSQIAVLGFLAVAAAVGLRSPATLLLIAAWSTTMMVVTWRLSVRRVRANEMWIVCIGNAILGALLSRLYGSLIIAPVVGCIMAVSLTSYPQLMPHGRAVVLMLASAWSAPVILERLGILAPTWKVVDGAIVSTSAMLDVGGGTTTALLIFGNILAIMVVGAFCNAVARSRREAQRHIEIQAWHLKQLLPSS